MRAPLSVTYDGNSVIVRGNAKAVLEAGGFRGIYAGTVRGWLLDRHRGNDLLAYLDSRRIPYRVTEAGETA